MEQWMPIADQIHAPLVHAALTSAGGWLAAFAAAAAPVAVAALWQGAAIALVLGFCLHLAPRVHVNIGAAQRFAVWAAAFAAVAALPFLPSLARGAVAASACNAPLGASLGALPPAPRLQLPKIQLDDRWALAIAALWLMVSLVRAANLVAHSLRLRRLWNAAQPVQADANLRALLAAASPAPRPTSRKVAELCTTLELDRPSVIGFFAPRILIPDWLFSRLTPGELEQVVLHEAEHLRRRDDWTNLLQKLALVLFPLNPALAWIEKRLCREREMACDEGVVRRTQAPRAYAACLASLAERALERRCAHALSLGAFERRPELVRRVSSLLARKPALHPLAARALVGIAACGLLVASVELARYPQMVAFVPAAPPATPQNQLAQADLAIPQGDGDRVFAQPTVAPGNSGFRALQTKAILPSNQSAALLAPPSARQAVATKTKSDNTSGRELASADAASRAVQPVPHAFALFAKEWETATRDSLLSRQVPGEVLRAEMPDADSAASQPEVVVLTAWEEVETSPRHAGPVADYDTGAPAQSKSGDSENPAAKQASRRPAVEITVMRLIFWLAPQPSAAISNTLAHGPNPPRPTASDSRRPSAPAAESGWLVLQL